jgi:hypothetical protein
MNANVTSEVHLEVNDVVRPRFLVSKFTSVRRQ